MRRRVPGAVLALLGALLALGPVAVTSAAPIAPTAGACRDAKGITVVVDFTAFDGGVQVRCAAQPVRSGFEALTKAGFTYQGTTQFPGLLCRIDGEPSSDPCHGAPPANAYWAYWHASRGGDWTYSTSGAGSRVPPPGSVEGWSFGDDAEPGIDPPAPAPTTTTTRPPTVTTRPSSGGGTSTPSTARPSTSTIPDEVAAETSTTTTGDETTTTSRAVADGADVGDDGSSDEQAGAVSPGSDPDGGSPAGAIVGLVAVAGLGAGALVVARRRRSAEGHPA